MIKKISTVVTSLLVLCITSFAQTKTPRQLYGDLFVAVQMSNVFPDNKTFVDCTPKENPDSIVAQYERQKNMPDFGLKEFVYAHFNLPPVYASHYHSDIAAGVRHHINELWHVLRRSPDDQDTGKYSSLIPLPYPYIVPGGRFREIYYWDSYFTMVGLQESGETDMVENMLNNFAYLINKIGFIPNGNRTYYLTRSQPPFFSLMVELLAKQKGDYVYAIYQQALLKEYAYWMDGADEVQTGKAFRQVVKMPGGEILNRYWDASDQPREESYKPDVEEAEKSTEPKNVYYRNARAAAESGMDFSSRWFADGEHLRTIITTDIVPVDLNCLMYHLERSIAISYEVSGNKLLAKLYNDKAEQRAKAIQKYFWNKQLGYYMDYNLPKRKQSNRLSITGDFPLFFKLADSTQAIDAGKLLQDKFLQPGGVVTTLTNTGQQWDAPNGWAPLEYMTIEGLNNYNSDKDLAKQIAMNWINLNIKVFKATGKLMEKYNVEDVNAVGGGGEYPLQDGFGWTNGVLIKLMDQYHISD